MRIIIICMALVLCLAQNVSAEMRHTFYDAYNPANTTTFVYDDTGATTTGDVVECFTYDLKTIFISCETIASAQIEYQVEGRCVGELDTWSILDSGYIGAASGDSSKNIAIDVTELVDYLRVGLGDVVSDGEDAINVRGIFRRSN